MGDYSERWKLLSKNKATSPAMFVPYNSNAENLYSGSNLDEQDQEDYDAPSDCESGVSGGQNVQESRLSGKGLIRMDEGDKIYETIKKKMVSSFSSCGFNSRVESIQRKDYSGIMSRARELCFGIYEKAMEKKCNGNANVKYAWYGAPKHEIDNILSHGFGLPATTGVHGHGIYLFPVDHVGECMQSLVADEDGLEQHVLLCRVILGRMEAVPAGSGQYNPSSEEFDSGVDNLLSPRKYIVWSSSMNTRILPDFVVNFKTSYSYGGGFQGIPPCKVPSSDWMPFATLINALSKFLPPDAIKLIAKHHGEHKKQKITRHEMIQRVRDISGDKLLIMVIKSYREKIRSSHSNIMHQLNRRD